MILKDKLKENGSPTLPQVLFTTASLTTLNRTGTKSDYDQSLNNFSRSSREELSFLHTPSKSILNDNFKQTSV